MSRLIDADELLEFIKNRYEITWECDTYEGGIKDACSDIIEKIDNLPTIEERKTGKWIPCSERLPERGEDVLVTRDYDGRKDHNKSCRYVEVASCYGDDDDILWSSYSDEYKMTPKNHHVIAWMPLPEPYKERREG